MGPRTLPWGTPHLTYVTLEQCLLIEVNCDLLVK